MRGLLFIGGDRPDMNQARRFFGEPAAIYAADSGIDGVYEAGFEPDCIVGDMDSIDDPAILDSFGPERIHRVDCDKDLTDTELAISLMRKKNIDEIVLVGGGGGRMDHFFALEKLFSREKPPQVWIGSQTIAFVLEESGPGERIAVDKLAGETISVFPVGSGPHRCTGSGLKWSVDALEWEKGGYSLSNRAEATQCSLHARAGRFLVILPLSGQWTIDYRVGESG